MSTNVPGDVYRSRILETFFFHPSSTSPPPLPKVLLLFLLPLPPAPPLDLRAGFRVLYNCPATRPEPFSALCGAQDWPFFLKQHTQRIHHTHTHKHTPPPALPVHHGARSKDWLSHRVVGGVGNLLWTVLIRRKSICIYIGNKKTKKENKL